MKRGLLASLTAAAMVITSVVPALAAAPALADGATDIPYDTSSGTFQIFKTETDEETEEVIGIAEDSYIQDYSDLTSLNGFTITFTPDEAMAANIASRLDGGEEWMNLAVGVNSDSTGWTTLSESSVIEGDKGLCWTANDDGSYSVTYQQDFGFFTDEETYAQIWIQDWSSCDGSFTINAIDFLYAEAVPVGHAYIAFGGDTAYEVPGTTTEEGVSVTILTDDSGDWGSYKDTSANVAYADLMALNEEGKTPAGVYVESAEAFGVGYNTTETDDDGKSVWSQADVTTVNEDGMYYTSISDIDLTEANFNIMIYDKDWGWGENRETVNNIEVTTYLMYDPSTEVGSWNTYYYSLTDADGNVNYSADVTQTEVEFASGEEFVLEADLTTGLEHAYFVAPTLVFNEDLPTLEEGQTYADLGYEVSVQLFVNDEEVEIDATAGDAMWAEDTGNNAKANTARVYGGTNEWGTKYVEQSAFEGATSIKYVITVKVPTAEAAEDTTAGDATTTALAVVLGCVATAVVATVVIKKRRIEEM